MQQTINYTNTLCNYDSDKIPLEQQICLLKANDNVKEKAILKLKEIKFKDQIFADANATLAQAFLNLKGKIRLL